MTRLIPLFIVALMGCRGAGAETPPARSVHDAIRGASAIRLYEGLPHPGAESELYDREKAKPHKTLQGEAFYEESIWLPPDDVAALSALLSARSSLSAWSGEKKCGGFHSDYAIEVEKAGRAWRVFVCFGCGEAKVTGGDESRHDLPTATESALETLLKKHRKHRPVPK
ncbi:MAG: hypothetical protein IV100_07065 [Myxococcales bacterium]|nr:hypothetical protein [Myxococcales bacterium]